MRIHRSLGMTTSIVPPTRHSKTGWKLNLLVSFYKYTVSLRIAQIDRCNSNSKRIIKSSMLLFKQRSPFCIRRHPFSSRKSATRAWEYCKDFHGKCIPCVHCKIVLSRVASKDTLTLSLRLLRILYILLIISFEMILVFQYILQLIVLWWGDPFYSYGLNLSLLANV